MKKAINISIGRTSFIVEDDAFEKLKNYLDSFEASIENQNDIKEVMEDVEARIAEIFAEHIKSSNQTVGLDLVDKVIALMGTPNRSSTNSTTGSDANSKSQAVPPSYGYSRKRFYRDPDRSIIGGVCSGVAAYFRLDILLIRILFICFTPLGGLSFWVYIILWIISPKAKTITEKLEMRGESVTAENIRNYSEKHK